MKSCLSVSSNPAGRQEECTGNDETYDGLRHTLAYMLPVAGTLAAKARAGFLGGLWPSKIV